MEHTPQTGDIYLAIREEENFVNAYLARHEQPEENIFIGCIHAQIMHDHFDVFESWKELMTLTVGMLMQDVGLKVKGFYERDVRTTPKGHA